MTRAKKNLGNWGEKVCVHEIVKLGFNVLETNYHTRFGEIDIIANDKEEIVFIEVKTRSSDLYGSAIEAISSKKIEHLFLAAGQYLRDKNQEDIPFRFDVATLDKLSNGNWKFVLIKNALS